MQTRIIMVIAGAIVVLIGGGLWWWKSSQTPAAPVPVSTPGEAPAKLPEEGEVPSTPGVQGAAFCRSLEASDDFVREQVSLLSPGMAEWLKQDDLVRRFAVVIDNARVGDYPRRQLGFLVPTAKFPVRQEGDRTLLDPDGYHRYDSFVDTAISVDPQRAAALLRTLSPLLVDSLQELGAKDSGPDDRDSRKHRTGARDARARRRHRSGATEGVLPVRRSESRSAETVAEATAADGAAECRAHKGLSDAGEGLSLIRRRMFVSQTGG